MSMIERVAVAIAGVGEVGFAAMSGGLQETFLREARAAIAAMREPTKEQIAAVRETGGPQAAAYAIAAWPTMIDAALREGQP